MKINSIKSKRLNEDIFNAVLDNGLKVFCIPKKNYINKYAIFATNYGSNDNIFVPVDETEEIKVPEGIAHFLEHKLFEEPDINIFDEFGKLGSYVNAFTNFNQTAYLFSCVDKFHENLELLIEFVQNPYFTEENVDKEKGIIEQEIRMYDDSPDWRVYSNCLSGLYSKHPVRIDIAGTVESINKIDKDMLYKCYNTFYNPKNMVLFMIGDIDFKEALEVINKKQKTIKNTEKDIVRINVEEPNIIHKKLIEENLSVSIPLFNIGYKDIDIGYDGEKLLHKEICTNISLEILFGSSSDFYQQLYEEGLINNRFGFQYVGNKDYGYVIIAGESDKPKEVLKRIINNIDEKRKSGLLEEDFNRTKKKLIGYYLMDSNSIDYVATNFINQFFKNYSMFDYLDMLEGVNIKDVEKRCFDFLNEERCCLSIINPK